MKAALCVRGREMLYDYCEQHGVPHSRCGKLLVATSRNQIPQLESIMARGKENGVLDLMRISGAEAQALEPALECVEAVFSPRTGIVDSHQLMLAIQGDAERDGAVCAFHAPVEAIESSNGRFVVKVGGAAPTTISAACVINSAGSAGQCAGPQDSRTRRAPCAAALSGARQLLQHLGARAV